MAVAFARPQSPRPNTHYNKRKRTELTADLEDAVKRLQQAIDRINGLMTELPINMQPLVDLLQTQTQMIEVLASHRGSRSHKRRSADQRASLDTAKIVCGPATHVCAGAVESGSSDQEDQSLERIVHRSSKERTPRLNLPCRQTSQIAEIVQESPSQRHECVRYQSEPSIYPRSGSDCITPITLSCSTCSTRPWYPLSNDLDHESLVQEATTHVITAMKSRKRIPVGPVDNAIFNLYSADYRRNHYCVHDRTDRQSLVVYSQSKTWEADFPGITPPAPGEVAMELLVYPDCLLIVKPFKVPKHAGWSWHTLNAIGDDARPTTVEIMFLGNGYLKLKVRLSELLGSERMADGEPDRWIEFAGVWSGKLSVGNREHHELESNSLVEPITSACGHPIKTQPGKAPEKKRYVLPPLPPLPPLENERS